MTKSSTSCRRCKRWLEGEWNVAETTEHRAVLQQEMDQGYCNICLPSNNNSNTDTTYYCLNDNGGIIDIR